MTVETASTVAGLVPTSPLDNDPESEGSAQIRLVKACVQNTVATMATEIATLQGGSAISPVPSGAIMMWLSTTPPAGWHICDGTNGTPNMKSFIPIGIPYGSAFGDTNYGMPIQIVGAGVPTLFNVSYIQKI